MNIWTYWEGPRPPYIELCLRSMRSVFGDGCVVVTPDNVGDYIPRDTFHSNYNQITEPAIKADCIRAALLAIHGGWWFDADTIALQSSFLAYQKRDAFYMTWNKLPDRVLNGYIAMRSGAGVGQQWLEGVNAQLASEAPGWCSLGERILTPLICGKSNCCEIPRRLFLPIDIDSDVAVFMEPGEPTDFIQPDTVCFGLNHSWMTYHHPDAMRLGPTDWSSSPLLIHRLFAYAQERFQ